MNNITSITDFIGYSLGYHPLKNVLRDIVRSTDGPPVRRHSVGREEGLTGHHTLTGLPEGRSEVLCWAKNTIGTQQTSCRFIVYTQGKEMQPACPSY